MKVAVIHSRASLGIDAPLVVVEVHLSYGIPSLSIVGLPEAAVKESKDRVRSAIINSGFEFPAKRITINLAPADLPKKDGGRFDLPIALGILIASEQLVAKDLNQYEFAGELALCGKLRKFNGILPFALATKKAGRTLVLSMDNASEAALVKDLKILAPQHLLDIAAHLVGSKLLDQVEPREIVIKEKDNLDVSDVYGQIQAKRALEVAAAGGHSLFMIGPPGVGKTMIANRLITILPKMSDDETLESAAIHSIAGKNILASWGVRPFRTPHHTASSVALVGGSSPPRPGEISLAHHGVLFLDELLEFNRSVLESLREPLESKQITISRAAHQAKFPAKFQLVVAMNPCPCGYFGDSNGRCNCTIDQIKRYRARLSGPFLDRIDLWIQLYSLPRGILMTARDRSENSEEVRARVVAARSFALARQGKVNFELGNKEIDKYCNLKANDQIFLVDMVEKLKLSARSYHKILKIARTVADLDYAENIADVHLKEAIGYRREIY